MKYIALDIGNVLCDVRTKDFLNYLSETQNITLYDAERFLKRFQQLHDLGYTTMQDELINNFHIKSPILLDKLVKCWNDSVVPNIRIISSLNYLMKHHSLNVALLSNIGLEHASMMEEKLSHGGFFPGVIKHFSCFVGARKPSSIFYQSFLLQYPEFKGCLYVDDLIENLNSSKLFGFNTLHFSLEHDGFVDKIKEIENIIMNS